MGDGIKWTPANCAKNWMNVCQGFQGFLGLPFIGPTLWQVGPMPWLMNFGGSSGWFGNPNWGNVGDSVQFSGTQSGGTKKADDESSMTPEEKLAAKEEKAKKKAEIRTLVDNYNTMYSQLEAYGNTLTDSTTPTKAVFEETLKEYKNKAKTSMEKEKLEEKIADIRVLYNKYQTGIQAAKLKEAKDKVTTANNAQYTDKVTTLNTALSSPTETFGILKKSDSGAIEWDKDVDIMELLSTWNNHSATKNSHIMRSIAGKYKTASGDNKSKYDILTNKLHERLSTEADNIQESKLSDETKKMLEDAKTQFAKFDTMAKRFPADETDPGKNYSNAFDNLYRAIRLAEAEIAEKELKESFDFLGDDNPYKTTTIVSDTKADLKSEFLENARTVTDPAGTVIPSDAQEVKVGNTSYFVLEKDGNKTYYQANGTEMTPEAFENTVGEVTINSNGSYSIKKGGTTTYYKTDHTKSTESEYNKAPEASASGTGTGTAEAPAKGSVQDAIGKQYNDMATLNSQLKYMTKEPLHSIIHNKNSEFNFNKESVIGLLDNYETARSIDDQKYGFITKMSRIGFDKHNCNRVIKAVMRQALSIGLNSENCPEYKDLAEFFGAQGVPAYKEDGFTPDNDFRSGKDTFEFTKNCEDKEKYSQEQAASIDTMLKSLINKIKELNK